MTGNAQTPTDHGFQSLKRHEEGVLS